MKQATLCYILDRKRVLLGLKKKGLGAGRYNGFGGKVEQGETPLQAARREVKEESGVVVEQLELVAEFAFRWPHKPEWDQQVFVFLARSWSGEPLSTDEMDPVWFDLESIPYEKMWSDDILWLPQVLAGKKFTGSFSFNPDDSVDRHVLHELKCSQP